MKYDYIKKVKNRPDAKNESLTKSTIKKLHVVSNTHWDREHRHAFQETRIRLVETIDRLIEIMTKNEDYRNFVFDGQTVILEDYLEIKPHRKDTLKSLVKAGRIDIGPWYTLPDMPTISPEAIVRNLLFGDRLARQFGNKMNYGYSIFSFGQIAQLPQIYRGFGIENMIVYKGYSPDIFKDSEFIWEAPDGSSIFASRLGKLFRINFLFCFTIPVILGGDVTKPGWETNFLEGTRLAHLIDSKFYREHAIELDPDIRIRMEKIPQAIKDVLDSVNGTVAKNTFLGFDGVDFSAPLEQLPDALKLANEMQNDSLDIIHSTLGDYFEDLRKEINPDSLFRYSGELRFGPVSKTHCECISANVEIKQANYNAENSILFYAEPYSVFSALNGRSYPYEVLKQGWKYLLKSQAHDSIHGTGVPKIKRDNLSRLEQANEIFDSISRRAFEYLISQIDTNQLGKGDIFITVFNPSQDIRSEVINLNIDLPDEQLLKDFRIETLDGQMLDFYEYDRRKITFASINSENRPKAVRSLRANIDLWVPEIPAMGYKTFRVCLIKDKELRIEDPFKNPKWPYAPIAKKPNLLDNGFLKVEINTNGTVNVTNKKTGYKYKNLNLFADMPCSGDLWIHREPQEGGTITNYGSQVNIVLLRNSNMSACYRVDIEMPVPESLNEKRTARSEHVVPTKISTFITLWRNSSRLDFKVKFNNECRDHKLTVSFPTGLKAKRSFSECAFEIKSREINCASNNNGKVGDNVLRHPMHSFLDISDGQEGVSLSTKGIKEYETYYDFDGKTNLDLTLLRAVTQKLPVHSGVFLEYDKEESQCPGLHTFEYSLYFHSGDYQEGEVLKNVRAYHLPFVAGEFGRSKGGSLPAEISFIKSSNPNLNFSCIKRAEDSPEIVIRLNNPTDSTIQDSLEFYNSISKAYLADLNETIIEEIDLNDDNTLPVKLSPYKIITYIIKPA